jgi:hypothetical protein
MKLVVSPPSWLIVVTGNVAFLVNPTAPIAENLTRDMQEGARALGLQLHVLHASTERDFDTVFTPARKFACCTDTAKRMTFEQATMLLGSP